MQVLCLPIKKNANLNSLQLTSIRAFTMNIYSETFTRSELSVETPTFDENLLFVSFKFLVLFGNKSV